MNGQDKGREVPEWSAYWQKLGFKLHSPDGYFNLFAPNGEQIGWGLLGYADAMRASASYARQNPCEVYGPVEVLD